MKISKIAIFTILILNGTVKSQEFYTCIPNDDWVKGKAKEEITDTYIQNIVKKTILTSKWTLVRKLTPFSAQSEFKGTLPAGRYRVTAAGAGGPEQTREFTLTYSQEYKACVGQAGRNSENNNGGAGGGGMGYGGIYCGGGGGDGTGGTDGGGGSYCLNKFIGNGGWGETENYDGKQSYLNGIKTFYGGGGGDSSGPCGFKGGKGYGDNGGKGGKAWCEDINRVDFVAGAGGGGGGYLGEGGGGGSSADNAGFGLGGTGCYGGGGGAGGYASFVSGGGGGGGGSYFEVGNTRMVLQGGNGLQGELLNTDGGKGAGPDGYVIIEKWE